MALTPLKINRCYRYALLPATCQMHALEAEVFDSQASRGNELCGRSCQRRLGIIAIFSAPLYGRRFNTNKRLCEAAETAAKGTSK